MGIICKALKIGLFSETYDEHFKKYCEVANWYRCKAIGWVESKYGMVKGGKGEIGIMQIMPATGAILGYTEAELWIEEINIKCGCQHFGNMYVKFGCVIKKAVIAYNYGGEALTIKINIYADDYFKHLPKSVQEYWNAWYAAYIALAE